MCHSCHWWQEVASRRITAMTILLLVLLFIVLPIAAVIWGADSRGLADHPWERLGS